MATRKAQMRALVLRMQAVIAARRMVRHSCLPTLAAYQADVRLRVIGAWIVDEMRRLERKGWRYERQVTDSMDRGNLESRSGL